ncbi:MAG: flippase [Patescibacteria group bacterium]|nr:flippase [Patescibacteria group bacterium]
MSSLARIIFKNTIWLSLAELVNGILMFFLTIWLARYLGASDYGKLGFALSLVTLFSVTIDFGFGTLAIREVARDKSLANKYLDNILSLRVLLSFIFLGLIMALVFLGGKDLTIVYLIMLTGAQVIFLNLIQSFVAIFRAHNQMQYEVIGKLIFSATVFILGFLFIAQKFSLLSFGLMYALAGLVALGYTVILFRKRYFRFSFKFETNFWKYLFRESWPFALSTVFISVYYYMDSVMLGFMDEDIQLGWYNAAYKIVLFILIFANVIGVVLFPQISRLYKESLPRLKELLSRSLKLMITLALPLGFGGLFLAEPIIRYIFGVEFLGGTLAFRILCWTAVVVFLSVVFGNGLQASDRQRTYLTAVGLGALVNFILNLILIPAYSLNGAAVATLAAELTVLIFIYIKFQKVVRLPFISYFGKPLIASLGMLLVLWLVGSWPVLLLVIIGSAAYIAILVLIRGITREEFRLFRDLVLKKTVNSPNDKL